VDAVLHLARIARLGRRLHHRGLGQSRSSACGPRRTRTGRRTQRRHGQGPGSGPSSRRRVSASSQQQQLGAVMGEPWRGVRTEDALNEGRKQTIRIPTNTY